MTKLTVDTQFPVLVTGASGYVAGVLIKELLDLGVTVHGTVRDPTQLDRLKHLTDAAKNAPGTIKFFKGDLMTPGSFADAMTGCSVVFHTASPVVLVPKDPFKDLVEPAVEGVKNVLQEAAKTSTVKRVVLTSSTVAIFNDASDSLKAPNQILTESDWNTGSTLDYNPYYFSKVKAEQAAWTIAGSQTQFSLVVINPGLVMGPGLKYHSSSDTTAFFVGLAGGDMASGCPNASLPIVDVRDVAHAHVMAAYTPEANGRNIINGSDTTFPEMADCLREKYSNYPLPCRVVPKFLLWLLAPYLPATVPLTRRFVMENVNVTMKMDNSKSKKELGMKYRPLKVTMEDMMEQIIAEGGIEKRDDNGKIVGKK